MARLTTLSLLSALALSHALSTISYNTRLTTSFHNIPSHRTLKRRFGHHSPRDTLHTLQSQSSNENETNNAISSSIDERESIPNELGLDILRGGGGELSDETWREIEEGAPSQLEILKSVSCCCLCFLLVWGVFVFCPCFVSRCSLCDGLQCYHTQIIPTYFQEWCFVSVHCLLKSLL